MVNCMVCELYLKSYRKGKSKNLSSSRRKTSHNNRDLMSTVVVYWGENCILKTAVMVAFNSVTSVLKS